MSTPSLVSTANEDRARLRFLGLSIDRTMLTTVLLVFVASRVVLFLIVWLSLATIPPRAGDQLYASPDNLLLDGLVRFDSWWYHNIATHGYTQGDPTAGVQGNVAFFPLYPLLVRAGSVLSGNIFLGGVLVSNTALLLLLGYLYALARREFDADTAARAVLYFAVAPASIFCSAMYTESLFLLLVLATFYHARAGQWGWAALAGALASATRNTGVLMAAVIALEGLQQQGLRLRPPTWNRAALAAYVRAQLAVVWRSRVALVAAAWVTTGLLSYALFLNASFGDPLAFIHVQAAWGRATSPNAITNLAGNTVRDLSLGNLALGRINTQVLLDTLATLCFAPLVAAVVLRMRAAYGVYTALTFLVPLSTGTTGSMWRYVLMLLPCFLVLAAWGRHRSVDRLVLIAFLPLMGYSALLFSHWYFVG